NITMLGQTQTPIRPGRSQPTFVQHVPAFWRMTERFSGGGARISGVKAVILSRIS
ncbi:hypothetical protein B0H10DRAFT_2053949, partial [Mycena sp. CBHHK59/15]